MLTSIRTTIGALAGAMLLAGSSLALAQQGVTDTEILLGEIAPLTGPASVGSLALSAGNKMAIAEANNAGGINGRKIRLISEDDGYTVARSIQAARKLITSDKVFALLATSGSAPSLANLPMLKEVGIPAMNVLSFPNEFHSPVVANIFVAGATHQDTVEKLTQELNKKFPNKKWAAITQDDELGALMKEGFDKANAALNLNVVYTATYRKGQKDFSAEILAATNAGAEILLSGGIVTENAAMVKELDRLGNKMPVGVSWIARNNAATLQMMGPGVDNVYMVDYVIADESAEAKDFMKRAQQLLPEDEFKRVNRFALVGYAGTKTMLEAMKRCGKDLTWACAIKELDGLKNFDTKVMAPISFSPDSHFSKQTLMFMKADAKSMTLVPVQ